MSDKPRLSEAMVRVMQRRALEKYDSFDIFLNILEHKGGTDDEWTNLFKAIGKRTDLTTLSPEEIEEEYGSMIDANGKKLPKWRNVIYQEEFDEMVKIMKVRRTSLSGAAIRRSTFTFTHIPSAESVMDYLIDLSPLENTLRAIDGVVTDKGVNTDKGINTDKGVNTEFDAKKLSDSSAFAIYTMVFREELRNKDPQHMETAQMLKNRAFENEQREQDALRLMAM